MVIPLMNMVFWALSAAANGISFAVFQAGAAVIVLVTQILRFPWAALMQVPHLAGTAIRAAAEWLVGSLVKLFLSSVASLFKLVPRVASGLVSVISFNATALMEETRHRVDEIMEIAEVFKSGAETMHSIFEDILHNFLNAAKYIMKEQD